MGAHSKRKGKVGELELVAFLKKYEGVEARRGQQFSGGGDSPDIVHNIDGIHIECKRTEALKLYPSIEQAEADRPDEAVPVVFYRRNKKDWVVVMYAEDFLEQYVGLTVSPERGSNDD